MWTILDNAEQIAKAQELLRSDLYLALTEKITCTVSGAGNRYTDTLAYSPEYGVWYSYQLQDKKHFNGFGMTPPKAGAKVALQSEINVPLAGVSKVMAAAFAISGSRMALIHRGRIRGGKALFFKYYQGETLVIDNETCALVAFLGEEDCAKRVCDFVRCVSEIKSKIKQER